MDADITRVLRRFATDIEIVVDNMDTYIRRMAKSMPLDTSLAVARTMITVGRKMKGLTKSIHANMKIEFTYRKCTRKFVRPYERGLEDVTGTDILFDGKPVFFFTTRESRWGSPSSWTWRGTIYSFCAPGDRNDPAGNPEHVVNHSSSSGKTSEDKLIKTFTNMAASKVRNMAIKHEDWRERLWPSEQSSTQSDQLAQNA